MPTRAMLSVGSLCNPREPAQPATALRPEPGTEGGHPAPDVEQAAVTSDAESKEDASKKEEQGAAALSELFAWIGPAGTQKLLTAVLASTCATYLAALAYMAATGEKHPPPLLVPSSRVNPLYWLSVRHVALRVQLQLPPCCARALRAGRAAVRLVVVDMRAVRGVQPYTDGAPSVAAATAA
eukprot:COSAG01_NODE_30646_length_611_cov_153.142578_1_plen_181_part_10